MLKLNNVTEWMLALAVVMDRVADGTFTEGDAVDALEDLETVSRDWMQTDEESNAQLSLVNAARSMVDCVV